MLFNLQQIAPSLLSLFMVGLAFVPLFFVWQDRSRRMSDSRRVSKLQHEARVAERLRMRSLETKAPDLAGIGAVSPRQKNVIG
nr:hypothetical protein [uncultured Roseococcus sp.]